MLRVREESEAPVANVELTVKAGKVEKSARTDTNGVARFDGFSPGDIEIRVRRVGYRQSEIAARIAAGENDLVIYIDPST
ncbi:MAG: carboxypeptidase-like regulatory domain-containing protein, partial [Gemmatimonadaceae bacterium]